MRRRWAIGAAAGATVIVAVIVLVARLASSPAIGIGSIGEFSPAHGWSVTAHESTMPCPYVTLTRGHGKTAPTLSVAACFPFAGCGLLMPGSPPSQRIALGLDRVRLVDFGQNGATDLLLSGCSEPAALTRVLRDGRQCVLRIEYMASASAPAGAHREVMRMLASWRWTAAGTSWVSVTGQPGSGTESQP